MHGGVIIVTALPLREKIEAVFGAFNFSGTGRLSGDELVIMLRLAVCGLSKIDSNMSLPPMDEFVKVGRTALKRIGKSADGEVTVDEFYAMCDKNEKLWQYLQYIDGCAGHARVEKGRLFADQASA